MFLFTLIAILLFIKQPEFVTVPDYGFDYNFVFKVLLAAVSGLLIGMEREFKDKNAGLKTNMLVALGSCVFILMSVQFFGDDHVDKTRVLSQVIIGIGFLGGGVILKKGDTVRGLGTAATIWCSAAAGCIAAFYQITNLAIFTGVVVLINVIFGFLDDKVGKDDSKH